MVKVTLSVNGEIVKRAKELGLNLSQCLENCLKLYIRKLEEANQEMIHNQPQNYRSTSEGSPQPPRLVDRAGFEPATSALRRRRSCQTELPAHFDISLYSAFWIDK